MHLFYTPEVSGNIFKLSENESKHCIRVLRLRTGDEVYLIDGTGGFYKALIEDSNPKSCILKIIEEKTNFEKRPYYLHIAMAPTKNLDRLEWFIEKAVEIGIDEFSPIICERSERRVLNIERLEKIAIASMKQSIKAYKPIINECVSFEKFLKKPTTEIKMIAYCNDFYTDMESPKNLNSNDITERKPINQVCKINQSAICLIGPEGDFTSSEIQTAICSGYVGISLGESRLRVETAGLLVCATVYNQNLTNIQK
jgi:16S rRNA (uracil1498-N3)-methyltransferase